MVQFNAKKICLFTVSLKVYYGDFGEEQQTHPKTPFYFSLLESVDGVGTLPFLYGESHESTGGYEVEKIWLLVFMPGFHGPLGISKSNAKS